MGGDIASNKKTFLLLNALNLASGETKIELDKLLSLEDFEIEEKVTAVTEIYNSLGIKELTEQKIDSYFKLGFEALDKLEAPKERKAQLKSFAEYLINREK